MTFNRLASILIAISYIIGAYTFNDIEFLNVTIIFCIGALIFIWFGDALGEVLTNAIGDGPAIDTKSPGCLVSFVGWVIFLIPIGYIIYKAFS